MAGFMHCNCSRLLMNVMITLILSVNYQDSYKRCHDSQTFFTLLFPTTYMSLQNISAPSGHYTIRAANGSLISVFCDLSFFNCSHILYVYSSIPSGCYTIQSLNSFFISVYCDIEGSNCDGKGGQMSVGYLNMSGQMVNTKSGRDHNPNPAVTHPLSAPITHKNSRSGLRCHVRIAGVCPLVYPI